MNARLPRHAQRPEAATGFRDRGLPAHGGLRVLVSVRDVDEALTAAAAGVDLIDLKEPSRGALGGLDTGTLRDIVSAVRAAGHSAPLSATIGDHAPDDIPAMQARAIDVAACGVDVVKIGVLPGPHAAALLHRMAEWQHAHGMRLVPVLMADDGVPITDAQLAARLGFEAVMLDTARKRAGSLLQTAGTSQLADFLALTRAGGVPSGLAGALRREDLSDLRTLAPDYAGFRSAVCVGDRAGVLDETLLRGLLAAAHARPDTAPTAAERR